MTKKQKIKAASVKSSNSIMFVEVDDVLEQKQIIKIVDIVDGVAAISYEDGEKIYETIENSLKISPKIELDFQNIDILTMAFLNASIGNLYLSHDENEINDMLVFKDLSDENKVLLEKAIEQAKKYSQKKEKMDQIFNRIMQNG